ncbi:hypothetical protein ACO2JO_07530 [Leptospira interrogans]
MTKAFSSEVDPSSRQENASNQESSEPAPRPLTQRLLWFAALWLGGVGTVTLISYGLRLWIAPK